MFTDARGYTYRTYRAGGKVRREYIGAGYQAELLKSLDVQARHEANLERASQCEAIGAHQVQDRELKTFYDSVTQLTRAVLLSAGYHQHKRGEWRRKRENIMSKKASKNVIEVGLPVPASLSDQERKDLVQLMNGAQRGDKEAAAQLNKTLDGPKWKGVARAVGETYSLASISAEKIINRRAGDNLLFKEGMQRKMQTIMEEMAGPSPSPLEKLLAERIALCWLHLQDCEIRVESYEGSLAVAEHYEKRSDRAHKRYLAAIKALAQVRKLQLPTVQINMAEQQVNIGEATISKG